MPKKTLLVEIGTEELPPKKLSNLAKSFAANVSSELRNSGLKYSDIQWFATPRRLALKVVNLELLQSQYDFNKCSSKNSQSLNEKQNKSKNFNIDYKPVILEQNKRNLQYSNDEKDRWLLYCSNSTGEKVGVLLPNIIALALAKLSITRFMRWGTSDIYFVRPVHTLTLLLGDTLIPASILGLNSKRLIYGHRFMGEKELNIRNAEQYPKILLDRGKVIADYNERKNKIKVEVKKAANKINGIVNLNDKFLEEITSLVEWPVILTAKFEEKFLSIPNEVLSYILIHEQKCFPVYNRNGNILPNFIFVANIESKKSEQIIVDNEKVVHSRLEDANFFFMNDRKKKLRDNLPYLQTVLFHNKLGTLLDKTNRIVELTRWIACEIGANPHQAMQAGLLSKCDLMTNMVFEFTYTQGVMGMYYARYDGEEEDVAIALAEQYKPRFSGDRLPSTLVSCALAIADKIDLLAGIFGIGENPKGNKDPFVLRRAAIGILRIIIEKKVKLDLQTLIKKAVHLYKYKLTNLNVINDIVNFMFGRLRSLYLDKGYAADIIQAVLACRPIDLINFDARIKEVSNFRSREEFSYIMVMNKRIVNILAKNSDPVSGVVHVSLLKEIAEIKLANSLMLIRGNLQLYFSQGRYQEALCKLASLREVIDNFFENVMVNTSDKNIRINRLSLLAELRNLFLQIADFSLLQ